MLPLLFLIVPAIQCNPESHQALIHVRQSLQHIPGHKNIAIGMLFSKNSEMCLHHLSFDSLIPKLNSQMELVAIVLDSINLE